MASSRLLQSCSLHVSSRPSPALPVNKRRQLGRRGASPPTQTPLLNRADVMMHRATPLSHAPGAAAVNELTEDVSCPSEELLYSRWKPGAHVKPVIAMPPANVSRALHMGHAMAVTRECVDRGFETGAFKIKKEAHIQRVPRSQRGAERCSSCELGAVANFRDQSDERESHRGRRQALAQVLLLCSAPVVLAQMPGKLLAEEATTEAVSNDQSIVGGLLSLFDPNETTKLGKKLPKAYLKNARDVVKTLRDSFSEDTQNDAKFRRNADSAKGAIREYISNWRGAKLVDAEESYQALERALRVLSEFYSNKGPRAALPEDVRGRILEDLQKADDAL